MGLPFYCQTQFVSDQWYNGQPNQKIRNVNIYHQLNNERDLNVLRVWLN